MDTKATSAIAKLETDLVKERDMQRMHANNHDHVMLCHGCGEIYAVRAYFIASSMSVQFKFDDNSMLHIPVHACRTCAAVPGRIKAAFYEGMRPDAYNRAAATIGAELQTTGATA